ncbi:hypothetical protein BRADI_4g17670v3 [Brachypodium distachyon]|uniref:Uncharacterized protein n=2 Tax=Brachypodium distachyon TaxID=15368 RepID=I1ILI5_BRADI|nr:hypothetical protein BRADI_4g17670v3 [Brachypodium distachyon]
MEAKLLKILAMLLAFCLCNTSCDALCSLSDLQVAQRTARTKVGRYQEFSVEVRNSCICSQTNVKLLCPGFQSAIRVDPAVIRADPDGQLCTLNDGRAVRSGDVIKFVYAWTTTFSFAPVNSTLACS